MPHLGPTREDDRRTGAAAPVDPSERGQRRKEAEERVAGAQITVLYLKYYFKKGPYPQG